MSGVSAPGGAELMSGPKLLRFDVTRALDSEAPQSVATWLFLPPRDRIGQNTRLIVCLPGGTYDKRYYHLEIPDHPGYSMAEHLARAGHVVLSIDHWGMGESTRPARAADITPERVAAANHAVTVEALRRLQLGTLDPRLAPIVGALSVGVGHSMGGMLTVLQQAEHRSHAQVVILGKSMLRIDRADFLGEGGNSGRMDYGDYYFPDRANLRRVFYWEDVPVAVIAADTAAQVATPGALVARTNASDVATEAAARIDVPVFLGIGERDTAPRPHDEPRYYQVCPDVTLFLLPRSAHCHNFASTRERLWDRLLAWIPTVV
jgi:alpha-beta hydrolase superfamily lysophospholipase